MIWQLFTESILIRSVQSVVGRTLRYEITISRGKMEKFGAWIVMFMYVPTTQDER